MKPIRFKIEIKMLLLGFVVGMLGCDSINQNSQIVYHEQLATQYFQNDAQWYLGNIPFFRMFRPGFLYQRHEF